MTFTLVYGRASSDPNDQRISVDRQIKLCTARAIDLWPAAEVKVFRDDSITAADPNVHRPGFAQFLAAVRSARKDELVGVVVNEQSRLTRQGTGAWDELVVTLTKAGVTKVETLRAGPVSVQPGSRLVGRLLAVVDAEEVERTKARVQDAHRELFKEGRPSGPPPFGYRMTKEGDPPRPAFEADPVESLVVQKIFDLALAGHALTAIADTLNAGPVPPRSARFKFKDGRKVTAWQPNSVRYVLTSPTLAGLRVHTDADGITHSVPAKWPALIDVDQWDQVQRILGRPTTVTNSNGDQYKVRSKPKAQPRKYLLSGGRRRGGDVYGVLACGRCGYPLVAQPQGRRDGSHVGAYQCSPAKTDRAACGGVSISPAVEVENLVVAVVQAELAGNPKLRNRLSAAVDSEVARWRAERDAARVEMREITRRKDKLSWDDFDEMYDREKARYEFAEARLVSMATDTVLPSVEDVLQRWGALTLVQQRAVVERLIGRIGIAPGNGGKPGFNVARVGKPEWLA